MSEFFLYSAIQDFKTPSMFISANQSSFQAIVTAWINFLLEHQQPTNIWLKLPSNLLSLVEPYLKQEYAEEIYWCGESKQLLSLAVNRKKIIYFDLSNSPALIKESFLLVKSVNFSGLLFASQVNTNELKLTYSFDVNVCQEFLKKVEDTMIINDDTSLEILTRLSFKNWQTTDTNLITSLLLKYTIAFQEIATNNVSSLVREEDLRQIHKSIKVQEDFLRELTEQMRLPLTNMKTALTLLKSSSPKEQQRQRYTDLLAEQLERQYALWSALLENVLKTRIYTF
jgi:two-component system, OmpR family, phosphate regulon sensor histidine kinase PhoR